jgi:hypothetical protein
MHERLRDAPAKRPTMTRIARRGALVGPGLAVPGGSHRHSWFVPTTDLSCCDTSTRGAEWILGADLSLMLVQEGRGRKETRPTAALGKGDGEAGVAHARELGYPATA